MSNFRRLRVHTAILVMDRFSLKAKQMHLNNDNDLASLLF